MSKFGKDCIAFAAPSGGGKTTICKMLLQKYPDLTLSVSFTTRAPRGAEKKGMDYHFVSKSEFEQHIRENDLIEWAEVHGNCYGTSQRFMKSQVAAGKVVLLDIDVQGVQSLKKIFGERCLSIFVLPPGLQELESRLRSRNTDPEEKIQERMRNAREEISHAPLFDFQVTNRDLTSAFQEVCCIVEKEVGLA